MRICSVLGLHLGYLAGRGRVETMALGDAVELEMDAWFSMRG